MSLLVSLCNRSRRRFYQERDVFLLRVDSETADVTPVHLPGNVSQHANGMTGIARRPGGYVAVLAPASLLYLSESLEVEQVFHLNRVHDGHGIAYHDGVCYIASSGSDSVVAFSPAAGEKVFWAANDGGKDTLHVNSVLAGDRGCWITAFGPKSDQLWRSANHGYVMNVATGERVVTEIFHPHTLCAADSRMYWCDSSRMTVLR